MQVCEWLFSFCSHLTFNNFCPLDAATIHRLEEEWIQTNVEDLSPEAHAEIRQREQREMEERRAEEGTYEDMVYGMLLGFLLSIMMCFFMVQEFFSSFFFSSN